MLLAITPHISSPFTPFRLVQSGGLSLLTAVDRLGNTPELCAANSGHRMLAHYLRVQEEKLKSQAKPRVALWRTMQQAYFAPIIWAATLLSVWSFQAKVARAGSSLPAPLPWMSLCAISSLLTSTLGLLLMAVLNASNPGYIPRRGERSGRRASRKSEAGSLLTDVVDITNLDCPALWAGRWEQLCVTCKIVRPLRAKHDEASGRCIEVRTAQLGSCKIAPRRAAGNCAHAHVR